MRRKSDVEFGPVISDRQTVIKTWWNSHDFHWKMIGQIEYPYGVAPRKGVRGYDGTVYAELTLALNKGETRPNVQTFGPVSHYKEIKRVVREGIIY